MLRRRIESNDLSGVTLVRPPESRDAKRDARAVRQSATGRGAPDGAALPLQSGRVNLSPRGFAFVTTEGGQAYYVRSDLARRLLTGDVIRFRPSPPADDGSLDVREVHHLQRREQVLLCGVTVLADLAYLVPDEPCFTPLQLAEPAQPNAFSTGDVVAVRIPAYDGPVRAVTAPGGPLLGALVANLGARTREGFDLDYARMKHGFELDLPLELEGLARTFQDPSNHAPTSPTPFVTIDGESTRDFDDAVYAETMPDGGWRVQVAVADVSHYVEPGSLLDQWAAKRGTSVYLPGLTLPMLPEGLSTDRCSLMPGVSRHAVVMSLRLSAHGAVLERSLERALIVSAARLSYREVAEFLATPPAVDEALTPVTSNLRVLHEVYKVLATRRKEHGRLDFEDPEPTAKYRDGKLVVEWEVRNDAHKLVEELMLLANQEAAGMLVQRYGFGLVRHQPKPTAEAWSSLSQWAKDHSLELPAEPSLKAMSDLVAAVPEGDTRAEATMKVRMSMQPARYVLHTKKELATHGGHFSLSAPWYAHFTSPIRRYFDLLVHRLLLAPADHVLSSEELQALRSAVERCADRSQGSRFAERLVWDRLKLKGFLDENTQDAVVSARVVRITGRGFRVVFTGWQLSAWLPGAALRRAGFTKGDKEGWARGEGEGAQTVREGALLQVSWTDLNLERPAYPELQVKLA